MTSQMQSAVEKADLMDIFFDKDGPKSLRPNDVTHFDKTHISLSSSASGIVEETFLSGLHLR